VDVKLKFFIVIISKTFDKTIELKHMGNILLSSHSCVNNNVMSFVKHNFCLNLVSVFHFLDFFKLKIKFLNEKTVAISPHVI
jgi:hypothetical protein